TSGLAGGRLQRQSDGAARREDESAIDGMEYEKPGSIDSHVIRLSPIISDDRGAAGERSVQQIAGAGTALPNGGRDDTRYDTCRQWPAQRQVGRPERLPT